MTLTGMAARPLHTPALCRTASKGLQVSEAAAELLHLLTV